MKTLLLGAGRRRERVVIVNGDDPHLATTEFYGEVVTLDINPEHKPDHVWDLNDRPLPFTDNEFDEIHAYEVLEHIGAQGDYKRFFAEFAEYYRILKPGGRFVGTCPQWNNEWAWADPSHVRILTCSTLLFLSQAEYAKQVGVTPMSDFRYLWKGDFESIHRISTDVGGIYFVMEAVKPSRLNNVPQSPMSVPASASGTRR